MEFSLDYVVWWYCFCRNVRKCWLLNWNVWRMKSTICAALESVTLMNVWKRYTCFHDLCWYFVCQFKNLLKDHLSVIVSWILLFGSYFSVAPWKMWTFFGFGLKYLPIIFPHLVAWRKDFQIIIFVHWFLQVKVLDYCWCICSAISILHPVTVFSAVYKCNYLLPIVMHTCPLWVNSCRWVPKLLWSFCSRRRRLCRNMNSWR